MFVGGPYMESRIFGEGIGIAVKNEGTTLRQAFNWALFRGCGKKANSPNCGCAIFLSIHIDDLALRMSSSENRPPLFRDTRNVAST